MSHSIRTTIRRLRWRAIAVHAATTVLMLSVPAAAYADPGARTVTVLAVKTLPEVIGGLQGWLMGILAAVATLFLVLGGVLWATAGGDPAAVERAKSALRNALIGYGLAVLAPTLLAVVKGIVGG